MEEKKVLDYFKNSFLFDLKAGFITAVVALPLAIAFAIASGVSPIMGLYTAIIAGILCSLFGGSRFSITGPTGAMTVIILSTIHKFGIEGLLLAGFLAGLIQLVFGLVGVGKFVKFIPLPIVSGFTAGIGVLIFLGQIPNFLGISLPAKEHVWETIIEIFRNFNSTNLIAVYLGIFTVLTFLFLPKLFSKSKYLKSIPPSFIALIITTFAVYFFSLTIPQVGTIQSELPKLQLINFNLELLFEILPSAFTIALLGMLESLLCAVVCDGMTNTRHNSDKELVAQGATNMILPFFNGIPATAAVARSAVNIKEGARTRMSGVYHALFLLLIVLFLAPIAMFIPKAFLAGVLMVVSFKMVNINEFKTIMRLSKKDTIVLLVTFSLTIFTDLVFAVQVGMILAIGLLFVRMTSLIGVIPMEQYGPEGNLNKRVFTNPKIKDKIGIYTIHGPFFFGALNVFDKKINEHKMQKQPFIILRMKHVPFIDSTGVERLKKFIEDNAKEGRKTYLSAIRRRVKKVLDKDAFFRKFEKENHIFEHTQDALNQIEKETKN